MPGDSSSDSGAMGVVSQGGPRQWSPPVNQPDSQAMRIIGGGPRQYAPVAEPVPEQALPVYVPPQQVRVFEEVVDSTPIQPSSNRKISYINKYNPVVPKPEIVIRKPIVRPPPVVLPPPVVVVEEKECCKGGHKIDAIPAQALAELNAARRGEPSPQGPRSWSPLVNNVQPVKTVVQTVVSDAGPRSWSPPVGAPVETVVSDAGPRSWSPPVAAPAVETVVSSSSNEMGVVGPASNSVIADKAQEFVGQKPVNIFEGF